MEKPLVSVLVPTFNQEAYILQTLNSINMQEVDFLIEVLIGDDASTDGTGTICSDYNFSNKRILKRYIRHDHNLGVIGNWKYLLSIAKGKYLAVCEGDDYWTAIHKLRTQLQILESRPDISICFHQTRYFDTHTGNTIKFSPAHNIPEVTTISELAQLNYIDNLSVVCRNLVEGNQYPDWVFHKNLPVPDYLWHMYNAQFGNIYYISECMADYRIRPDSVWSSVTKLQQALSIIDLLLVPLYEHMREPKVIYGLHNQVMNIFYEYALYSSDVAGTNELIKRVVELIPNTYSLCFLIEQNKALLQQNQMLKKSFSYKLGSFLLMPKRILTRGK